MRLTPITIQNITVENNVFLAPLAGYTNYPFRRLCKGYGAGLCYTEMVSAKGLKYGSENTEELLYTDEHEGLCAAQIFGSDPAIMRNACEHEKLAPFPIVRGSQFSLPLRSEGDKSPMRSTSLTHGGKGDRL